MPSFLYGDATSTSGDVRVDIFVHADIAKLSGVSFSLALRSGAELKPLEAASFFYPNSAFSSSDNFSNQFSAISLTGIAQVAGRSGDFFIGYVVVAYDKISSSSDYLELTPLAQDGFFDSNGTVVSVSRVDLSLPLQVYFSSAGQYSAFENTINAASIAAVSPLQSSVFSYSIAGGADASLFAINASTGALTFKTSPNFEAPADAGANNVYDIVVQASDGSLSASQAVAISVTNVNEAPSVTSGGTATTLENVSTSTAVYTATGTDPDANTTLAYSISGGPDAALFNINPTTGAVTFKTSPNFEAPADAGANNVYDIVVQASDGSLSEMKAVAISVTDILEPIASNLQGISYFWKPNASGQHALLGGVTVSTSGATQSADGANAAIQLKNIAWNAGGHATADIFAHVTSAISNVDVSLNLGGATGATFNSTLSSDWAFQSNQTSNGYFISGVSLNAIGTGDVKVGSISFDTGLLSQTQLGINAGTKLGSANVSPYGFTLAHDTSTASGAYSITPIDAGSYALIATRDTMDIGAAINSADALAALKIAVSMNPNPTINGTQLPVSPFQIMAADINGDGGVSSADALAILKIAVHISTAITPQWVFVEDTRDFYDEASGLFTLTKSAASWDHNITTMVSGATTENLVGVLMGDVNGSWTPPAGSQYVEAQNPTYFTDLSNLIYTPVSEWAVL